ncbi:hypothetical protein MTO96_021398 [Rhipicephalus appendiculatus]
MLASFVTTRHALCPILVTGAAAASSRHGERNRDERAMRDLVACTGWKGLPGEAPYQPVMQPETVSGYTCDDAACSSWPLCRRKGGRRNRFAAPSPPSCRRR